MKHLHFDVETAGFYGAYWACAGGSDCAVIAMIGDDPEDRLARSAAKWLCGRGVNVLTMSPAKKDYGHHNYPLERIEAAISWLKANGNQKIGIAGGGCTGTLPSAPAFRCIHHRNAGADGSGHVPGYHPDHCHDAQRFCVAGLYAG